MRLSLGRRARFVTTAMALLAACATALLLLGSADAARGPGTNPTWLILRLSDLSLGYLNVALEEEQGDHVYCSRLTHPEDTPAKMARFVDRFHPRGCLGAYTLLYTPPGEEEGPELIGTGALPLRSDAAADAGWKVVPEMLGRLMRKPPHEVKAKERVGSATRLFHTEAPRILKRTGSKETFLVWRSGNTLAAVLVVGNSFAEIDRQAAALARLQDAHIRQPSRYTLAERFDGEVPLDDPKLNLPVYWLGRNFRPGGELPNNRLFDSYFTGKASRETHAKFVGAEAPGAPLTIRYANIWLTTWTLANWRVFAGSDTAKAITSWKCTQARTIPLAEGTATIFGGYKRNYERCPKGAPEAFTAWVDIGGVKVVVNSPPAPDFIETVNPYGSFAGMEAILRSLALRPKRFP
jgi:hypothetical protein